MTTLVNKLTGEVYEIQKTESETEKNQQAIQVLTEAKVLNDYTEDLLFQYEKYNDEFANFKYELLKAMQEHGIKKCSFGGHTFTLVEETISYSVDTKKLKDAGLYDEFSKASLKKAYLQVKEEK